MWTLPYFHVPAVTLTGNGRLTREEIEAVLGINGRSIFLVQPDELAARLRLNYPEITSARVRVYLPNYVYVDLIERQPVILWQQGSGYTWIDAEGVAFRPRGLVEGLVPVAALVPPPVGGVPQDDTLSPPPFLHRDMVQAILQLAPAVPADSTLTYDAQEGLGWQDSRGWKVYFGSNSNNTALKLRVYQSLVESLTAQGRIPEYINVAFPDAPYYRMAGLAGIEPIFESGQ
jgi:cell division protein FtsQ